MADEYMLPSGEVAQLEQPDLYVILSQVGAIPDPLTSRVLTLLELEGITLPEATQNRWQRLAEKHMGMYGVYAWCRVDKKLDLKLKFGDGKTTLGRMDIPIIDLEYVYYNFFRTRNARKLSEYTQAVNTARVEDATSDLYGLQDVAKPVSTDG